MARKKKIPKKKSRSGSKVRHKCSSCGHRAAAFEYCYGCCEYICEKCDVGMPWSAHVLADHLKKVKKGGRDD